MKTLAIELLAKPLFTSFFAGMKSINEYYDLPNSMAWILGGRGMTEFDCIAGSL